MLKRIPIFVIEDVPVDIHSLHMPQDHDEYEFAWHSTVGTWVRSRETFDMYATLLSTLEGDALIFMDLGLDVNVPLTMEEVEELANWAPVVAILGGKCQGWILIKRALENTKWRGIIEIASNRAPDLEDLRDLLEPLATEPERVQLKVGRAALSADSLRTAKKVFDSGIKEYLQFVAPPPPAPLPPLETRLWPNGPECWIPSLACGLDTTADWFGEGDHASPMHNYGGSTSQCRSRVRTYLHNLLGVAPPEHWFNSEEEFFCLWEELKCLTGWSSSAQGDDSRDRNLTLGNTILVLAATTGVQSEGWLWKVHWSQAPTPFILPEQTQEQARKSILALGEMFYHLCIHDKTKNTIIHKVKLIEDKLQIWIGEDYSVPRGARRPLLDKVRELKEEDGTAYKAYRKFLIESAKAINPQGHRWREARCVVNMQPDPITPEENAPRTTLLEIVLCKM